MNKASIPTFFMLGSILFVISVMISQVAYAQDVPKINEKQREALELFSTSQSQQQQQDQKPQTQQQGQTVNDNNNEQLKALKLFFNVPAPQQKLQTQQQGHTLNGQQMISMDTTDTNVKSQQQQNIEQEILQKLEQEKQKLEQKLEQEKGIQTQQTQHKEHKLKTANTESNNIITKEKAIKDKINPLQTSKNSLENQNDQRTLNNLLKMLMKEALQD